jgi:hypothetical protein
VLLRALFVLGPGLALAQEAPPLPRTPMQQLVANTVATEKVSQLRDDGTQVRFGTDSQGPVHVWWPRNYRPASATLVIYVHGFYTHVDDAVEQHRLFAQFRDSGRNALFIVPEAASAGRDVAPWPKLDALLEAVEKQVKVKLPQGGLMLIGHSGAYRNLTQWLEHPKVSTLVLIDALYGGDDDFRSWLAAESDHVKQLVLVGFETSLRTSFFLKKHPEAVRLDDVPWLFDGLTAKQKTARVLSMDSRRYDHMALITDGRVLPLLLHSLP